MTTPITHHALEHLDAFVPVTQDAAERRPAVMFIHGGGWFAGNRQQFLEHARQLAERGFVTATVSYRLSGVAPWPAQLEDVQQQWRELHAQAEAWQIDPQRIGVVGSSAGGHLAACLATRPVESLPRPACVADIHGVHDCSRRLLAESLQRLLGAPEEHPERWHDASPIHFVDEHTSSLLLTHAPDDPIVPYEQTELLIAALVRAARPFTFIPTPGSGHGFIYNLENAWAQKLWPDIVRYLEAQLKQA